MIYFDNAATSFPKAPQVGKAMADFIANDAANPGRAGPSHGRGGRKNDRWCQVKTPSHVKR